jgi:hypothetical protein
MLLLAERLKIRVLKNYDPNKSHGHKTVAEKAVGEVGEVAVEGV